MVRTPPETPDDMIIIGCSMMIMSSKGIIYHIFSPCEHLISGGADEGEWECVEEAQLRNTGTG